MPGNPIGGSFDHDGNLAPLIALTHDDSEKYNGYEKWAVYRELTTSQRVHQIGSEILSSFRDFAIYIDVPAILYNTTNKDKIPSGYEFTLTYKSNFSYDKGLGEGQFTYMDHDALRSESAYAQTIDYTAQPDFTGHVSARKSIHSQTQNGYIGHNAKERFRFALYKKVYTSENSAKLIRISEYSAELCIEMIRKGSYKASVKR